MSRLDFAMNPRLLQGNGPDRGIQKQGGGLMPNPKSHYDQYAAGVCKWCERPDLYSSMTGENGVTYHRHIRTRVYIGECLATPRAEWYEQQAARVKELEISLEDSIQQNAKQVDRIRARSDAFYRENVALKSENTQQAEENAELRAVIATLPHPTWCRFNSCTKCGAMFHTEVANHEFVTGDCNCPLSKLSAAAETGKELLREQQRVRELELDKARLDWLDSQRTIREQYLATDQKPAMWSIAGMYGHRLPVVSLGFPYQNQFETVRAAIDSAMTAAPTQKAEGK